MQTPRKTPSKRKRTGSDSARRLLFKLAGKKPKISSKSGTVREVEVTNKSSKKARKVMVYKPKKKVKVSRTFRAKVQKTLAPKIIKGQLLYRDTQAIYYTTNHAQNVYYLGKNISGVPQFEGFFDPLRVLDAASCLFNGKASMSYDPSFAATGMFEAVTLTPKIRVIDSSVHFKLRNNTQRTRTLIIYECRSCNVGNTNGPLVQWQQNILAAEARNQIPVGNLIINKVGASPYDVPDFGKYFKTTKKKVVLEAGQSWEWFVQGPQDFVYNFAKYYNGSTYLRHQKMNRYFMVAEYFDMLTVSNVTCYAYRFGQQAISITNEGGLAVEVTERFKIEMPELSGFTTGTVTALPLNSTIELDKRTDQFRWFDNTQIVSGVPSRIEETTGMEEEGPV